MELLFPGGAIPGHAGGGAEPQREVGSPILAPTDELGTTNYRTVEQLDVPISGNPVFATNYISVSMVDTNPPLRMLRTDCIWYLPSRGVKTRGPFTNTVVTLRCSDQ